VQVALLKPGRLTGRQDREETVEAGRVAPPVTVPPVADITMPLPPGEDTAPLLIPIAVVLRPAAIVRCTTAATPFEMIVLFIPEATQLNMPTPPKQFSDLPAAVMAVPEFTKMETTFAGGYVTVHSIADGSLPAGDVRVRFKATVPSEAAVPDDKTSESGPDCAIDAGADNRKAIASVSAIWLRVENLFIGYHIGS
jgi:hypothetical protein